MDINASESRACVLLETAVKEAQVVRKAARSAIAEASALREKTASAYAREKAECDANIGAITQAVAAFETGFPVPFFQTQTPQVQKFKQSLLDAGCQDMVTFLSGTEASGSFIQFGKTVDSLNQAARFAFYLVTTNCSTPARKVYSCVFEYGRSVR